MRKYLLLLLALTFVAACTKSEGPTANGKKKLTIAVIPKGTTHEFWKAINTGAIKAERELNANARLVEGHAVHVVERRCQK